MANPKCISDADIARIAAAVCACTSVQITDAVDALEANLDVRLTALYAALIAGLPTDVTVQADVAAALAAYQAAQTAALVAALPTNASVQAADAAALAAYGVDGWTRVAGNTVFAAGGIVVSPGSVLYTPTANLELIRGFVAAGQAGNPLVGAGGATSLSIGVKSQATGSTAGLMSIKTFAAFNGAMEGAGPDVSQVPAGGYLVLGLAGALGATSPSRSIRIYCDAGTASGTVDWQLERKVILP